MLFESRVRRPFRRLFEYFLADLRRSEFEEDANPQFVWQLDSLPLLVAPLKCFPCLDSRTDACQRFRP